MDRAICCIDDKIPVDKFPEFFNDTEIVEASVLRFLVKKVDDWGDKDVKNIMSKILSKDKWNVSAFRNPVFFINHYKSEIYSPEVILYDWDYEFGAGSSSSEDYLLEILKSTFAIVIVYTGCDSIEEINGIIKSERYVPYSERIAVIDKGEPDSIKKVFEFEESRRSENFSHQFARELSYYSNSSLNHILSRISSLSIKQFAASFGTLEDGKYIINSDDLIDVVFSKYKHVLYGVFNNKEYTINGNYEVDQDLLKSIWSYRLYYNPETDCVCSGDIVKNSDNRFYLVISSDCHMSKFWKTNFGFVCLVPLYNISNAEVLREYFYAVNNSVKNNLGISSIGNCGNMPITILPGVPLDDDNFVDFVALPKEITNYKINRPKLDDNPDKDRQAIISLPLSYKHWEGFSRVTSVSDPFKHPLLHFIMDNITGYGCPDFPTKLQNYLKERFKSATKI